MKRGAVAIVVSAAAAAVLPLPPNAVERWYTMLVYPAIQRVLTPASNLVPFALFDVLCVTAVCAFAVTAYRCIGRVGWRTGGLRLAGRTIVAAAAIYLVFLAMWGLNYRRVPIVDTVVYDPSRITSAAARDLGDANAVTLNRLYAAAHGRALSLDALGSSFDEAVRRMGRPSAIAHGRPKSTLLGGYFHEISVSGMTDPFFLETLVAPDLFDVEQPFVIAHEWAHLAGYADESEANFIAWLACRHGDALAQYSAALATIGYADPSRALRDALEIGPKMDLWAMQYRYRTTNAVLRVAARRGYDTYLKANRVEKGVDSYDAVVQLILGTQMDDDGYPRRR
jgi:Protein of unknown function (DUF3810)